MNIPHTTHPTLTDLKAFGLGKMHGTTGDTILQHLETCADCRRIVVESSGDSFLQRLQAAKQSAETPAPDNSGTNPAKGANSISSPTLMGYRAKLQKQSFISMTLTGRIE